ncbi:MAG: hypothetical protein R3C18_22275 [Planctomycetaceae bacterium]
MTVPKEEWRNMGPVPRKTVEELCTLYELEPTVRDVFVEGADDKAFLKWYLEQRGASGVSVFEIDAVELPPECVIDADCEDGRRGRVIAFGIVLNESLQGASRECPTLVCDADTDNTLGGRSLPEFVVCTDFSCLEMYLFNESTFAKLMNVVLKGCSVPPSQALQELSAVLVRLWIIKTANHEEQMAMTWMPFDGCCRVNSGSIAFDESEFIKRYLQKNGQQWQEDRFRGAMQRIEQKCRADARHQINGHHMMTLTRKYMQSVASDKAALVTEGAFVRCLYGCAVESELDGSSMFSTVLQRVMSGR